MSLETLRHYVPIVMASHVHRHQAEVIARYRPIFHPDNLGHLTVEDFYSFLLHDNNQHWHGIHRHWRAQTADMHRLREALFILLDESRSIVERYNQLMPKTAPNFVTGLGRAVYTPILIVVYSDRYGVYNGISERGLRQEGFYPVLPRGASSGDEYAAVNDALLGLAAELDITLWDLDGIWGHMLH